MNKVELKLYNYLKERCSKIKPLYVKTRYMKLTKLEPMRFPSVGLFFINCIKQTN